MDKTSWTYSTIIYDCKITACKPKSINKSISKQVNSLLNCRFYLLFDCKISAYFGSTADPSLYKYGSSSA